jgi:hypothetical protein
MLAFQFCGFSAFLRIFQCWIKIVVFHEPQTWRILAKERERVFSPQTWICARYLDFHQKDFKQYIISSKDFTLLNNMDF